MSEGQQLTGEQQERLFRQLGEIGADLKAVRSDLALARKEHSRVSNDHDRRIRSLERRQWITWGGIAVAGAAAGAALKRLLGV